MFCFTPPFLFAADVERGYSMGTKKSNKLAIRTQIIQASHVYQNKPAGKVFLYVIGDTFFEVVFQTKCFLHLTGVGSTLSAQDFYEKAKKSILTTDQIYFDQRHPYYSAKKTALLVASSGAYN